MSGVPRRRLSRAVIRFLQGEDRAIRVAYHEAGHALLAHHQGFWVKGIEIGRRDGSGICRLADAPLMTRREFARFSVAGSCAEEIWCRRRFASADFLDAYEELSRVRDGERRDREEVLGVGMDWEQHHGEVTEWLGGHKKELTRLARLVHRKPSGVVWAQDLERLTGVMHMDLKPRINERVYGCPVEQDLVGPHLERFLREERKRMKG